MTGLYRIAEKNIEIVSLYDAVQRLCRRYAAEGEAELVVRTSQKDLDYEREKSAQTAALEGREVQNSPDAYLETLAVYRKIAEWMPSQDTMLFHGSCVAVDGVGYLFTAASGTGKSTHVRLWRELFGERAVMVNDDKPLIRVAGTKATVFGTPWDGKHRLSNNIAVPLGGLCILERAAENSIVPVTASEAYPMLIQQSYRPTESAAMIKTLQMIGSLASSVPLYRLGCNMDISAAELSYAAMSRAALRQ